MLAALRGTDLRARAEALVALESGAASVDEDICRELIVLLGHDQKEVSRRAAGALARAASEPRYRALLENALEDDDPRRRWCACFALARAGVVDEAVLAAALEALGRDDGDVRWAAAEIVCGAVRAQPDTVALLCDAARSGVAAQRKMALYCLRDLGFEDEGVFVTALSDEDRGVRMAALAGLSRRTALSDAAVHAMISMAESDTDDGVRRAALATLQRRRTSDAEVNRALDATERARRTKE